ncbi:MAG: GTP cyclohydrolase FolE2 [Saezia sp.]
MSISNNLPVLPDVQSNADLRHIFIDRVGVKSVQYPVAIVAADGVVQNSIGEFELYVSLEAEHKGTHMSRFLELLDTKLKPLSVTHVQEFLGEMVKRLGAQGGYAHIRAPFFVRKQAPVSGVSSLMNYEARWTAERDYATQKEKIIQTVLVPVKSLCPCSKEISKYGAHNQRSHVIISVELDAGCNLSLEEQIRFAEESASCEIWGLLKRADEKYVTEVAYENPKFVEDLVRDVAIKLNEDERIVAYEISSENFESIHNHSAYACIKNCKK